MASKLIPGSGANDFVGTGRRKATAVARVRIRPGEGRIVVNDRPLEEYFPVELCRRAVVRPLEIAGRRDQCDVIIRVRGGGISGQADAAGLGIARALAKLDSELAKPLRDAGLLTFDARKKERKKYGLRGARRGTQFSKR